MSDADGIRTQVEILRQQTIDILDDLKAKTKQFELSKPPQAVEDYRQKLAKNEYNILVVGEAKRGKSSFINALIGRDLLPTNADIATNQVFRVHPSEQEAYRLRFEDNSAQAITANQLVKYGSEGAAQLTASHQSAKPLRWIEVDVPVRFLPSYINCLDTPGIGALCADHAQITQRFVLYADAVIYVLESSKPIDKLDMDFIEKILRITPYIFFVQTKIDQFRKEQWQELQQRNEEILLEQFQDRLKDTHVWPISSRNLMQAAKTNDEDYWIVSRHKELDEALQNFLFRAAGWDRCVEALTLADHFFSTSRNILAGRLAGLETISQQGVLGMQQLAMQRQQQFDAEWGTHGRKRRELRLSIQKVITTHKQSFTDLLEPDSKLEMTQRDKINAVKSIDEANKLGAAMDEEVITRVINKWHIVCEQSRLRCIGLLDELIQDSETLIIPTSEPDLEIHIGEAVNIKGDLWSKLVTAQSEFKKGSHTASNVAYIASIFIVNVWFPPLAILSIVGAGVWAAAKGWKDVHGAQVKEAQHTLHDQLTALLREVRQRFFYPNQAYDGQSLVSYYFDILANAMDDQIQQIADEKSDEAHAEIARLDAEMKLDEQQRSVQARQVQEQLSQWDSIGRLIRSTASTLKSLDQSLVARAATI